MASRAMWLAIVALASCNSTTHAVSGDASPDVALGPDARHADARPDAPPDAPADAPPDAGIEPVLTGSELYIKASNTAAGDQLGFAIALAGDSHTIAAGAPFQANGAGAVYVYALQGATWAQQAFVQASNTGTNDHFGWTAVLSHDGSTLAVGAPSEASCAVGIGGSQADNSCGNAGAVYVLARDDTGTWTQQAYVKPSNTPYTNGYGKAFGQALALSADGSALAVGGPGDSSAATGVGGSQFDTSAALSGAVYVFARDGSGTWSQQAYIKASNTNANDVFGSSVALSAGGDVLAVGAPGEASAASGVDGSQLDNSKMESGAAYVFHLGGSGWVQDAYIKASNPDAMDAFGSTIAISGTGKTLAVGAIGEASDAIGIDGDQSDNSQPDAGAVYVFQSTLGLWSQQAYLKEARSTNNDELGIAISIAYDGNTIAAGAPNENGSGTGITTPQSSRVNGSGVVYVFRRAAATWSQLDYIKASNTGVNGGFGASAALSADASALVVGASGEASAATGIGGDQSDTSAPQAGAAYLVQ